MDDGLRAWLLEADEEIRRDDPVIRPEQLDLDDARAHARQMLDLPLADRLLAGPNAAAADESYRPISEHGPHESML